MCSLWIVTELARGGDLSAKIKVVASLLRHARALVLCLFLPDTLSSLHSAM
jgi:hypothetical protein